ncbi:MAG TPA: J domain-containing protein [Kofleriaceae bacterium]|nr:J domain-containing protein [Kofleriaceae bacterium]
MSTRSDVLLWAQRVVARRTAPAYEILELRVDSSAEDAQAAFHKIARFAHPDLHRNGLPPEELELVTSAYGIAAGAYQTFRNQSMMTTRMKPLKPEDLAAAAVGSKPAGVSSGAAGPTSTPPTGVPTPSAGANQQMNSRALVYYRKAEIALRRGDLKGALLQIKMAIASDPSSAFLRTALAEVETELRKTS